MANNSLLDLKSQSVALSSWDGDLQALLAHVRPDWQWDQVKQKIFTDGITNKLVALHRGSMQPGDDVVLVRVYGEKTELIIDRDAEVRTMLLLHDHGLGPRVYAKFANGLCYQFIAGNVGDEEMVRQPDTSRLIARELAQLHTVDVGDAFECDRGPCVWKTMRKWLALGPDEFPEPERNQRLMQELPRKQEIAAEIDLLESKLANLDNCPIVFSHNDTLIKNFVHCPHEERVRLIDYEYCAYNYLPFDIGNHFNEFAGVDVVDHAKYPSKQFQLPWLRNYLRYRDQFLKQDPAADDQQFEARVKQLFVQVNQFSLASHLFWALWALVQARHSAIDFDFLDYGISRFAEYRSQRDSRLAITAD